jgi:hypothetical protein
MALRNPIAVYNASSNFQVHVICEMLLNAGIDAAVVEDVSMVGAWMFGLLPEIHKPQVWTEKSDVDRAKPLLEEFERREGERRLGVDIGPFINVTCEECRRSSLFPSSRRGSVETCSHCGAYVDVGDECEIEGWDECGDADQENV